MRDKMTHKLTKEEIAQIIDLLRDNKSPTDIAKKFNVSRQTVYNIKKKYMEK
jgi:transposase